MINNLPTDSMERDLRILLNDFLQDIDNEGKIDSKIANAIVDVHLRKLKNLVTAAHHAGVEEARKSTACCECGDALETKDVMRKLDKPTDFGNGLVSEVIDHEEYYCFGCDKTYILALKDKPL